MLEAEAAVDPVDRAFGRGAVGQAHGVRPGVENQLLRGVQAHRGLLASRSIGLDGAFEQDGGDTMLVVVVADVETRAEDFDVQAVGRHDERRPAVVLDLEIGFTLHLHAALARKEGGDVLHAARRIEPHLRPVGQHHLRPLAQLGDDGHGLRQALGKQHGREPAGQEHRGDHGRSGYTHRAPAQGDTASGVHAALELPERTLDVDTGRVVDTVADI